MRENNIVSQFKQHRVIFSLLYSYVFHVATFKKMKLTAELGYEHLLEAKFFLSPEVITNVKHLSFTMRPVFWTKMRYLKKQIYNNCVEGVGWEREEGEVFTLKANIRGLIYGWNPRAAPPPPAALPAAGWACTAFWPAAFTWGPFPAFLWSTR